LTGIERLAHGSLPNGAPPATISADSLNSLRFIAFNEIAEVAFFSELIGNITHNVPGYQIGDASARNFVLNTLNAVVSQEELHALNANGAVVHFSGNNPKAAIQPCKYDFPVSNFDEAIALASTFTDVVLGTLQDVTQRFGMNGDAALIRGVASVIGQEGEQNGYYRSILSKVPSALPFLTTSTREFAFSAINQNFVVPNSCPNVGDIKLPIFRPLTLESTNIKAEAQRLKFSLPIGTSTSSSFVKTDYESMSVVYINQQNKPVYEKPVNFNIGKDKITFEAVFPFDGVTFGNGLTIAVLANGPVALNAPDVAKNTQFGPALIEIN